MNERGYGPSRRWVLVPLVGVALLFAAMVSFWFLAYRGAPSYAEPVSFGWWPIFGWFFLFPLFFIGFLVFRWFFWGGWWWGRGRGWGYGYDPALEILRERFARGEISQEQYEQMKRSLEAHSG